MTPMFDNDALVSTLRELRPEPDPGFAATLDQRAAAGFPRDRSRLAAALASLAAPLRGVPPRRVLAYGGAVAACAVLTATAVVSIDGRDSGDGVTSQSTSGAVEAAPPGFEVPGEPSVAAESAAADSSAGNVAGHNGPYASRTADREIERSASIVLGTDPGGVRDAAAGVFDAVHAADGIVLDSSVTDGPSGRAGARFSLLIPSGKLGDALAEISSAAEVRSRQEATDDITAPTVTTRERLQEANAAVRSALGQLAGAESAEERATAEADLRAARSRAAAIRANLAALERRANFSRVSVRIVTGEGGDDESGAFGIGDGFDTGSRLLATAAGITLIGLAAIAPFALLALLVWGARRAWLARARRHALARS